MWKKVAKWSILALLTAYVVVITVWSRQEAARHTCKGIEIEIVGATKADSITKRGIRDELDRYPEKIVGTQINNVNTLAIADYLRRFNAFESVECIITSSGTMKVQIVPMIPAIRVFDNGKSYYVNKDGKIIDSKAEFFVDVPVVSGKFSDNFRPESVLPVVRFVTSDSILNRITGMFVAYSPDNIMLVPRISGHIVNFGDTTRLPEKRRALLTAYRNILPYKGWDAYDTISVKFRDQIVASRRDKAPLHPATVFDDDEDPEEATLPQPDSHSPSGRRPDGERHSTPTIPTPSNQ